MRISKREVIVAIASSLFARSSQAQERNTLHNYQNVIKPPKHSQIRSPVDILPKRKRVQEIDNVLALVSRERIEQSLTDIVGFGTRWTLANNSDSIVDWICLQFVEAGYSNASLRLQTFQLPNGVVRKNVICSGDQISNPIIVGAHYDSVSENPPTVAPGANDNGSGLVSMIETATALRKSGHSNNLIFIAFGGEEQGLWGSRACAEMSASERWNPKLMINLDMVGYAEDGNELQLILEYDQGNASTTNDAESLGYAKRIAQITLEYTKIRLEHANITSSDYMPFEALAIPCVGFYDGSSGQPFYHSTSDTRAKINTELLTELSKALTASLIDLSTA